MQMAWTGMNTARAWVFWAFFLLLPFPQSLEQLGKGREVRAHTYPSMPACALPSNLTCLLLLNSWKNVKLSSVIKVGFSKGFKNISEFKTLFLLQKINPSGIPLTGASWDLNSLLVFISGYRVGLPLLCFPLQLQAGLCGSFHPARMHGAHVWLDTPPECT